MNTKLLLSVILVLVIAPSTYAQVLSSEVKSADELLEDYLLAADEMATSYCVQITGTLSQVHADGSPSLFDLRGFTAIRPTPVKASYYACGLFNAIEPAPTGYWWCEALRYDDTYLDKRSLGETPTPPTQYPKDDDKRIPVEMSMIDPFGLALIDEGGLSRDRSKLSGIQSLFLGSTLDESKLQENGDVIGIWTTRYHTKALVRFAKDQNYFPVETRFRGYDKAKKLLNPTWGGPTTTQWQRYGNKGLAPAKISIVHKRDNGTKLDFKLEFRWLPPEVWQKSKFDFKPMTEPTRQIWRTSFIELFEQNAKGK